VEERTLTRASNFTAVALMYGLSFTEYGCGMGILKDWACSRAVGTEDLARLAIGGEVSEDSLEGRLSDKVNVTMIVELNE